MVNSQIEWRVGFLGGRNIAEPEEAENYTYTRGNLGGMLKINKQLNWANPAGLSNIYHYSS